MYDVMMCACILSSCVHLFWLCGVRGAREPFVVLGGCLKRTIKGFTIYLVGYM